MSDFDLKFANNLLTKLRDGLYFISSSINDKEIVEDKDFNEVANDMESLGRLGCVKALWLTDIAKVMNKLTETMWYSATITICRKILDILPEEITEETKYFVPKSIEEVTELIDYILLFPRSTDKEVIELLEVFAHDIMENNITMRYAIYGYGIKMMIHIDQLVITHNALIDEFNSLVEAFEEFHNITAIRSCRRDIAQVMCIADQSTDVGRELIARMSLYQHEMHYFINVAKVEEYL